MNEPSLKKNFALRTLYQVLLLVVPFITAPYVSRVLTADGVGVYSFTNSIQTYFSMFAALGTVSYGTREIARNRNDKEKRSKLFWEIESLSVLTSFFCILIYTAFIALTGDYKIYFLILGINIVAVMLDVSWFYTGIEQLKYTVGPNVIFKIIGVVSIFLFVKTKNDIGIYIFIMSMVFLLSNLTMWIYLPKYICKVRFRELKIRRHFKETLVYFIPTIATSIYTILDKTLIGIITTENAENGYYEQATKIVNMAKSVCFVGINAVLGSRISYLFAEKQFAEMKKRISVSMDYILFMGLGICFGLVGVSEKFVPLFFGPGYDGTIPLLRMMSPLVVIVGISNCLGDQYYNPAGLRSKSAKYIIIGSAVNLVLNLILIPHFKSKGAAVATVIAETVITILYFHNCNGYYRLRLLFVQIVKKIIIGLFMMMFVITIGRLTNDSYISLFVQIIMGGAFYCLALLLIKDTFMMSTVIPNLKRMIAKIQKEEDM